MHDVSVHALCQVLRGLLLVWIDVYLTSDFESHDLALETNADMVTYIVKHTPYLSAGVPNWGAKANILALECSEFLSFNN